MTPVIASPGGVREPRERPLAAGEGSWWSVFTSLVVELRGLEPLTF
jgi:hypothetical protein